MTSTTPGSPTRSLPFGRPWLTDDDRRAVAEVLDGHVLTHGPRGRAFEEEFARFMGEGASCVSVSSCMAALHLSYLHLGLGPGDEVIVPAQTHVATAHAVEWVGATPVFVDCERETGNVTPEGVLGAITPRTKAISVVHFLGIPCAMSELASLAGERGLSVVEDCALAVGARWDGVHVGLFGDTGCFSFYPVKHLTTGDGGMFVSRHPEASERIARLRAFGVDRTYAERSLPGMYDVPALGLNYRMSELQAALGRSQLARVGEILARRSENFRSLKDALAGLAGVRVLDASSARAENAHYCLTIVLEGALATRRDAIAAQLNEAGVGTSLYYPQPVPRMRYYREKYGYGPGRFPEAESISDRGIALPVGPHLTREDMDYIAHVVERVLGEAPA